MAPSICNILFWISLLSLSSGYSIFDSKERYYSMMVESRANGKKYNGFELQEPHCKDRLSKTVCAIYEKVCDHYKIIKEMCRKSCGLCPRGAFHPSSCHASRFGCCWDNITRAIGPNGKGCPDCVDVHPDCDYMKYRCDSAPIKRVCPITCGVRCEKCEDDVYQAEVCPFYKMTGFCQVDPYLMRKHCKKTCGFC